MKSDEPWTSVAGSSYEAVLLLGICGWLTHSFAQETSKRRLPRVAVKGVGGLLEFDAIEKALEIAGYRVSGHDEGGIERMDVFARDRAFGVTLYPSKLIIYGRHRCSDRSRTHFEDHVERRLGRTAEALEARFSRDLT